jgi:tRNA G18 (ribose-2'-O)-methylase SpoU
MNQETQIVSMFQTAQDQALVVIEGVQALKHAVRFGADIKHIATYDSAELELLLAELAPDIAPIIAKKVTVVSQQTFVKLSPKNHRTKVVSLASKKIYTSADVANNRPIVFLEDPKDLENIGAVIRVAAAADCAAVIADSQVSIWHSAVIRGGAGLQFALPVFTMNLTTVTKNFKNRKLIALDPTGKNIKENLPSSESILVFGTERSGITKQTLERSDQVLSLPMKRGVSSLNLGTSVAATLYLM